MHKNDLHHPSSSKKAGKTSANKYMVPKKARYIESIGTVEENFSSFE